MKKISKQKIQGFTLIELMIVVAIIAILAAIAVGSYQTYLAKSQVSEAFLLAGSVKYPVADYYGQSGAWPKNGDNGIPAAVSITGNYVASVTVSSADGSITVLMKNTGVSKPLQGKTFKLTPNVSGSSMLSIKWTCTSDAGQQYITSNVCQGI